MAAVFSDRPVRIPPAATTTAAALRALPLAAEAVCAGPAPTRDTARTRRLDAGRTRGALPRATRHGRRYNRLWSCYPRDDPDAGCPWSRPRVSLSKGLCGEGRASRVLRASSSCWSR
eukprot:scaffold58665_cov66-Phaeocystis_antarctica.AAC.1